MGRGPGGVPGMIHPACSNGPGPAEGLAQSPRDHAAGWRDDAVLVLLGTVCWFVVLGYFHVIGFQWLTSDPRDQYWLKSTQLLRLPSDLSLLFQVQHRD